MSETIELICPHCNGLIKVYIGTLKDAIKVNTAWHEKNEF